MSEVMNIPHGWRYVSVDESSKYLNDGDWIEAEHLSTSGIRLIQTGNIGIGNFKDGNKKYISEVTFKQLNCKEIFKNDILICRLAEPIARSCKLPFDDKSITSVDVSIFRPKDTFSSDYILYAINQQSFLNNANSLSGGSTRQRISRSKLKTLKFLIPNSKKEQEKIAEILSEVDSAIEHAQALHVKHQKIKTALMQDLLTHGIDLNGKIRNPKTHAYKPSPLGDIPAEWDVKEIGKIYKELRTGSTPSRAIPDYFKGDILWVTSGELKYKPIYDTIEKITKEAVRATNLKIYPSGTFFIAITGLEAEGTRGSCAIIAKEATTNQSCMAFEKNDQIDTHFLFQYYKLHGKYISLLYSQGSKQQSLNNKIVSKILIHLPPKEEQQKIAQILSSHDEKIEKVKTKLEKLKQLKTALMQDLLSGTKRVNHLLGEEQ
ncbi:MAG: restriction endonuclease subunit S [Campylobacterales bacterium]|nr:restriction endonuclease subunit S [Campylobacterales bacterium]